ncbi:hypothetical protein AAG906_019539 [Vitis piasezkii]
MHGSFDYQEVIDKLIEENEFDADQKDAFKRQKKPIDKLEKPRKRPCRNELVD